jgi:hypothetical protein
MKYEIKALRKLSICPCGFAVLDDSIQVGTKYRLYMESMSAHFRYRCGRCGKLQYGVAVVNANSVLHPDNPPAPIPYGLFEG